MVVKSKFRVYCEWCQDWHFTDEVEFLNIEEDFEGQDVMHFECGKLPSWNEETSRYDGTWSLVYKE
jgi:hypothetical protein